MSKNIIEAFEVIEIEENERERHPFAFRALQFFFQGFLHKAAIEQAREWVSNGLFPKRLAQAQVSE